MTPDPFAVRKPFADRSGIVEKSTMDPQSADSINQGLKVLFQDYAKLGDDSHVHFDVDLSTGIIGVQYNGKSHGVKAHDALSQRHDMLSQRVYNFLSKVAGFAGDASESFSIDGSGNRWFRTSVSMQKFTVGMNEMRREMAKQRSETQLGS